MTNLKVVDVRNMPPAKRHPLIFSTLGELKPGDSLKIINDHDPKPLKYQLEAEQPGSFEFEYLEEGPVDWQVMIKKVK